jgi:hypothetical protein
MPLARGAPEWPDCFTQLYPPLTLARERIAADPVQRTRHHGSTSPPQMQRSECMSTKKWLIAGLAAAATLGAGVAQAQGRDDVQWSVTIGSPIGVPAYGASVYSAPVYSAPVYSAPVYGAPVYRQPQVVYAPVRGHHYRQPTRWDRDGDGIPNRYDRVYNPRWDRDGDGIPNRYDRNDGDRGYGDRGYWRR